MSVSGCQQWREAREVAEGSNHLGLHVQKANTEDQHSRTKVSHGSSKSQTAWSCPGWSGRE